MKKGHMQDMHDITNNYDPTPPMFTHVKNSMWYHSGQESSKQAHYFDKETEQNP